MMKKLICPDCKKSQSTGKFCLDCGKALKEIITNDVGFKKIETKRPPQTLKIAIRKWLNRIGVQNPNIQIQADVASAQINYIIKEKKYSFISDRQKSEAHNLAAIEQFIHYRVLGIEWGIETEEKAFSGYEALPNYVDDKNFNPYQALGFKEKVSFDQAMAKYKQLARMCHPDVNDSTEASRQFQSIKKAIDMIEKENK